MKKRLEGELISIAHRILKLKNKAELDLLYLESRKLYETLAVLKFVEDNMDVIHPKMLESDIEKMIDNANISTNDIDTLELDKELDFDVETNLKAEVEDLSKVKNIDDDLKENAAFDKQQEVKSVEKMEPKIFIESFMDYSAEFVKKETINISLVSSEEQPIPVAEIAKSPMVQQISFPDLLLHQIAEPQFEKKESNNSTATLNDVIGKSTTFGLNDRVGFVKYLFDGSEEDFNRVISQAGTLDNIDEVKNFIVELVKPDYNNWENKEDYEARFMDIVLSRFN